MADTLDEEHYKEYPLADAGCRVCKLPVEDIKKLHRMKFVEETSFQDILSYLKMNYNLSLSMTTLVEHFNRHTSEGAKMKLAKTLDLSVANELEKLSIDKNADNADNLQTAYAYLTKTCMELSESSAKILTPYMQQLKEIPEEKIRERIEKSANPLKTLEQMARIQKLISDHVQTISQMRAPKVVVAQFLELAVNEVIRQTSYILAEACKTMEIEVCEELKERHINIGRAVFNRAFSKAGSEFRNAMLTLKREQLTKALEVLSEIEKIV